MKPFGFGFMQRCRIGIAADQKGGNLRRKFAAQPFDGLDAGAALAR